MRKIYDRNRLGYVAAQADARPSTVLYDPYFPVAPTSSDRASFSSTSAGHTLFDPYRPRRGHRPEF